MRKLLILLLFTIGLAACGDAGGNDSSGNAETKEEKIVYRFGHAAPEGDPGDLLSKKMADEINSLTDGQLQLELFPGAQLGGEVEMVEQVRAGTIDIAFVTGGALSNFVQDLKFLDLPFLFEDLDHAQEVLKGEVGQELSKKAEENGIKILSFMNYGIANISNTKRDIFSPNDLKGLKLRTLENEVFIDTFKALGAEPIPIPYPELYTSIQQGIVDGTDPLYVTMTGGKLYEVNKHFSEVELSYRAGIMVMNLNKYNELDETLKNHLNTSVQVTDDYYHSTIYPEYEKKAKKILEDNGVKITSKEDIDIESFKKAVQPVYDKHEPTFNKYIEKIKENK